MARTKTIKLSSEEYNLLKVCRRKLIEHGVATLPKALREKVVELVRDERLTLGKMTGIVALALSHTLRENVPY